MTSREQIEVQLAALTAQLDRLDAFPAQDPYRDGQALRFKWQSPTSGRLFNYVALRAGGKWYTTGRESAYARPWSAFVQWLITGKVDVLEALIPKSKYDKQKAKTRAAVASVANQIHTSATRSICLPDPVAAKDLFEDLVALRAVEKEYGTMPTPLIDRVLEYALSAIRDPFSTQAATFLAAVARFEKGMLDTDSRDR